MATVLKNFHLRVSEQLHDKITDEAYSSGVPVTAFCEAYMRWALDNAPKTKLRAAALDMLLSQVAALLLADRSLGGMVSWLEPGAPQASDTVPMEGAESLKGAVLPVTLFYETPQNPME